MDRSGQAVGSSAPTSASPSLTLSLIIPAYNEGSRLGDGVARLSQAVAAGAIDPMTTEFVVVDDGSTDDTTDQAEALFSAFPHVRHVRLTENHGKGGAVRAGVAVASAPVIAFADADMAIDPAQTPQFIRALDNAELAIGSRTALGSSVNRPSLRRSIMNRAFNRLVNVLTDVSLDDTQCGYKAFRAPAAKLLFHCSVTERFAFDVEVLSLARRLGLPIAQVPVQWLHVKGSQIRPWTDARSMAVDVFRAGRGRAAVAPVPTLVVTFPPDTPGGGEDAPVRPAWRDVLPAGLSLVRHDDEAFVLCPLMSAAEIDAVATVIGAQYPDAALERTTVTVMQLCDLAPLTLEWSGDHAPAQEGNHSPASSGSRSSHSSEVIA